MHFVAPNLQTCSRTDGKPFHKMWTCRPGSTFRLQFSDWVQTVFLGFLAIVHSHVYIASKQKWIDIAIKNECTQFIKIKWDVYKLSCYSHLHTFVWISLTMQSTQLEVLVIQRENASKCVYALVLVHQWDTRPISTLQVGMLYGNCTECTDTVKMARLHPCFPHSPLARSSHLGISWRSWFGCNKRKSLCKKRKKLCINFSPGS